MRLSRLKPGGSHVDTPQVNRDEAKQLEVEVRRSFAESGTADGLLDRIDEGIATSDDPGAIGLLLLARVIANQSGPDPATVADDAMRAAAMLDEAGEHDAAVFAEAVGGVMLLRAGDVDASTRFAVRTLAALERMPVTEEWGSRTANSLGLVFGELHAFELAARSSSRSLAWREAYDDPTTRVMIETIRGYYAVRAAETHPADSAKRADCIELAREPLLALDDLGDLPAAAVTKSCLEIEIAFLTGATIDPDRLDAVQRHYEHAASPWVGWHQLLHGRALNAAGRHHEAITCLQQSLDKRWSFGEQAARRELARSFAGVGRTEDALAELERVVDQLDDFVRSHVARQARELSDRVDAEKRAASLRERSEQLADQVAHDHLTGVASRRALDEFLDQPVDALTPNAVLVCDLDHFKMINDCYGHATGDDVLIEVGRLLREHTRAGDVTGRLGGEEFVTVMAGSAADATEAAERLRTAIEAAPWHELDEDLRVTVSIGVAVGTAPLRDLLRAADLAVYDAKNNGRNRVRVADGGAAAMTIISA